MYKLEVLSLAKDDIYNIISYISKNLKNITAAKKLIKNFEESAKSIMDYPYGIPVYQAMGKLENEYRCIKVKNFLMFYTINEKEKTIIIVRIVYRKMNMKEVLK